MLSVIDELCMRVCSFHWILLKIQLDTSTVHILDSLDKPDVLFSDMKEMPCHKIVRGLGEISKTYMSFVSYKN
jgi:hypothetical protein